MQEKRYGDRTFRIGDKVIQLRNNYNKGGLRLSLR
jgi:ATP-dependent exoDNAse (exonuclease V) alpha subunit